MANKLIVVEGTDCSGKQTQSEKLKARLSELISVQEMSFPMYDTPTGKIIGGCYLGKEHIGKSYFAEGAINVSPKVAGLYYAADRYYNLEKLEKALEAGTLILDRYVDSNMAHQAGKYSNKKLRFKTYKWFEKLEYKFLKLPKPNIKVLLFVPYEYGIKLKANRLEKPDEHEKDAQHLINAQNAYLEIAKRNRYKIINCIKDGEMRSVEDINDELFNYVTKKLGIK